MKNVINARKEKIKIESTQLEKELDDVLEKHIDNASIEQTIGAVLKITSSVFLMFFLKEIDYLRNSGAITDDESFDIAVTQVRQNIIKSITESSKQLLPKNKLKELAKDFLADQEYTDTETTVH